MEIHDYIIAGGGASGLMLAYRMSLDPYFDHKSILIIDVDTKDTNDRTWCYWERGSGEWDHILSHTWNKIYFGSPSFERLIDLNDYRYKMIRSADFYRFIKSVLSKRSNFVFVKDRITNIEDKGLLAHITTETRLYSSKKVFTSIFDPNVLERQTVFPYLKQHFVGWFVKSAEPVFDDRAATFMDFNISQKGNTRFMYVLPTSPYEALVEYTLFSEELLEQVEYEAEIEKYLYDDLKITNFVIQEKEQGNIPMICFPFFHQNTANVMYIGSAGGWSKASTGFTFANTMKYTKALIPFMKGTEDYRSFKMINRYWYYDLIFLDVLHRNNALGSQIFSSIFAKNGIKDVLQFLDEEASILTDLAIMLKTKPTLPFVKSACLNVGKMAKNLLALRNF